LQNPSPAKSDYRVAAAKKPKQLRQQRASERASLTIGTLVVGMALTGGFFAWSLARESDLVRSDVQSRAGSLAGAIQREIMHRTQLLDSLGAYVAVTRAASRADFRAFVASLVREEPGSVSLDWIPVVASDELKLYEEKQWLQGVPERCRRRATCCRCISVSAPVRASKDST
jgi:hypothetical protein